VRARRLALKGPKPGILRTATNRLEARQWALKKVRFREKDPQV
jgi:hypothetical protein